MIHLNGDLVVTRDFEQVFSEVDGEIVMLSIANEEYYSLSNVGSEIWRLIEQPTDIDSLISSLLKNYSVDYNQCRIETESYLKELYDLGLIKIKDA